MNARATGYAATLILILLAAGCTERAAPAAEKAEGRQQLEARLKQLRVDRVEAAKMARNASQAAYEAETVTLDNVIDAIDGLWKSQLGAADTAAQRTAAHVQRIEYLWQLQMKIKELFEKGQRGGEATKMYRIEYCLTDAEIALVDACIADGQPAPPVLAELQKRPKVGPEDDDAAEPDKP